MLLARFQCTRPSRGMVRVVKSPATRWHCFHCGHLCMPLSPPRYCQFLQVLGNEPVSPAVALDHRPYGFEDLAREN